jgi:rod shape-determining protein MreC
LLTETEARNQQLVKENQILLGEALRARSQAEELQRVKSLCGFREQNEALQTVPARVVGRDVSQFFQVVRLRLDVAGGTGLQEGQAVITHDGVVGRIDKLSTDYADVMLVTDARSEVHANVPGKGVVGSVKGQGKRNAFTAQFSYLDSVDRTLPLASGDAVLTTGHDRIFPPGLEIGHIAEGSATRSGQYHEFVLAPAVSYATLEEVLIVTSWRRPADALPAAAAPAPLPPVAATVQPSGAPAAVPTPAPPAGATGRKAVDPANTPDSPP